MKDWLILNNLKPFTPTTMLKATTSIKNRLGLDVYTIVQDENDAQTILNTIKKKYKPEGTGVYAELIHQLHGLTLESSKDIAEYTRKFREVSNELKSLHNDVALPEPYLCHLFFTGLGEAYQTFVTIFIQTHNLFGSNALTLTEVSLTASNEEQRMRTRDEPLGVAMLVRRGAANSGSFSQRRGNRVNKSNREGQKGPCAHCKDKSLPSKHDKATCWQLHPWLKPMKFKSEEEKKKYLMTDPPADKPSDEPVFTNLATDDYSIRGCSDSEPMYTLVASIHKDLASLIVIDSGCSRHVFNDCNAFIDFRAIKSNPITSIGGQTVQPTGEGTVQLSLPNRTVRL